MSIYNSYYPSRIGDQNLWLNNFRVKIPAYQETFGYTDADMDAVRADLKRAIYLLGEVKTAAGQFAESINAYIRTALDGPVGAVAPALPAFSFPDDAPPSVAPGALKRLFAFIKNLKTRPAYTAAIGEDLGIIGDETENTDLIPVGKAEARSGEVLITFRKMGHLGVWIESQIAADTTWSYLAIDTSSPYNDNRPLRIPGQPEKRRYRLCYWDGEPTNDWSDILEATFGG